MTAHVRSRCEVFCIFVEVYTLGDELSVVFIHLYIFVLNTSILFHAQPLLHCSSTCSQGQYENQRENIIAVYMSFKREKPKLMN